MTLRTIKALAEQGLVQQSDELDRVAAKYAVAVTPIMAGAIRGPGRHSGIALQFIPSEQELSMGFEENVDPIADRRYEVLPGLIHRYPDRVLLKVHHACPVYCRFCFRREMVGPNGAAMSPNDLIAALNYLKVHAEIKEAILTGGDPFMLSAKRVEALTQELSAIPHLEIIRWHTRVPVVDPARVTPEFVRALTVSGKAVFVGLHANHPDEIGPEACAALARLADAGIVLISQSVLLRGVNDNVETLEALMRAFLRNRVKPYYLHQMDPAPGTAHFTVPVEHGRELISQLRDRMTGLGIPAYVADGPTGRKRHLDAEEA